MTPVTATGIALILSTLIYHGGLAYLFARSEFGDVLKASQVEKLVIIARHPGAYRRGCGLILLGWIVAAVGYVMLAILLRDAGGAIVSTLSVVLFLLAIVLACVFWTFHVSPTLLAAEETAQTSIVPAYYEPLRVAAEASLRVYLILGLVATAGFGWALLQTGTLPAWVAWATIGWGVVWAGVSLVTSEGIPLLPMVMPLVIGVSLLVS
jgi:hypothetical protein